MTYLKAIHVYNCYASQNFDIDFSPFAGESFRHLIVTGKNGSGKTTLLNALDNALMEKSGINEFDPKVDVRLTDGNRWCLEDFLKEALYDYFKIERDNTVLKVKGPKKIDWTDLAVQEPLSQLIVQFLVNKKTEQAYAYQDGDQNTVQQIEQWFNQFEQQLKFLFDEVALRLEFSRQEFNFYLQLPEQAHFDFNQLSHGYAQVISIIAEILIAIETKSGNSFSENPSGIILIDEIENHLHLELQEKILPFLTTTFPKFQFIVATHSPAVIASINNATVYDLSSHRTVNEILTGIPYHVLMKSHFGIESEYSRVATEKLKIAKELIQKGEKRTEADNEKLRHTRQELDELSPDLSLDIFLELERQRLQ
jgi:predicted ATP-binding protein involved in virulence